MVGGYVANTSPVEDTPLQAIRNSVRASSNEPLVSHTQVRPAVQYGSELMSVFALEWNIAVAAPGVCCQATAAQPQRQQGKHMNVGLPDISELSPQLQQEWHPANNALLGGIKIKPYSN